MPYSRNHKIYDKSVNGKSASNLYDTVFGNRYFIVAITAIVILVLMFWLSSRLEKSIDNAEQVQFDLRLSELRSAVLLMQASLVAKDELSQAFKYEGANPMDWFNGRAPHYLGEMSLKNAEGNPGNWVFDPEEKVIAYLPSAIFPSAVFPSAVRQQKNKAKWLRYKVIASFSKELVINNEKASNEKVRSDKISNGNDGKEIKRQAYRQIKKFKGLELKAL